MFSRNFKGIQRQITKKRLTKNKHYKKMMVLKPLIVKRFINPIQNLRFLEYSFPLDADIFEDFTFISTKDYSCIFDVYDHKMATSVEYDEIGEVFTVKMREKIFDTNLYDYNLNLLNYYFDWLKSLGNSKAIMLIEILKTFKMIAENDFENIKNLSESTVFSEDSGKQMLMHIDSDKMESISKYPYRTRTVKVERNPSFDETGCIEESFSYSYLKMLGYENKDEIFSKLLKFEIQRCGRVRAFFDIIEELYTEMEKMAKNGINDILLIQKLFLRFNDIESDDKYSAVIKLEKWYENGCLYQKQHCNLLSQEDFATYKSH